MDLRILQTKSSNNPKTNIYLYGLRNYTTSLHDITLILYGSVFKKVNRMISKLYT